MRLGFAKQGAGGLCKKGNLALPNLLRNRKPLVLLLALMAMASVLQGVRLGSAPLGSSDLGLPLKPAHMLFTADPYQRIPKLQEPPMPVIQGDHNPWPPHPVQVPSVLMLLWPYAWMSWPTAKIAWLLSNLLMAGGLLLLAFRRLLPEASGWTYAAIASLFLMSMPARVILANGQHLFAALFCFLLALDLADRRRPLLAGIALAAAFLKYSVILFLLPYLVLKRQWSVIAVAIAIHAAMSAGIGAWLGSNPLRMIRDSMQLSGSLQGHGFIDLFSLCRHAGVSPAFAYAAILILLCALAALAFRRGVRDPDRFLGILCVASVLLVYHRGYDFAILLIPALIAFRRWPAGGPFALVLAATIVAIGYIFSLLPYLGIDNYSGYRWVMAVLCYGALATGMMDFYTMKRPPLGWSPSKAGPA